MQSEEFIKQLNRLEKEYGKEIDFEGTSDLMGYYLELELSEFEKIISHIIKVFKPSRSKDFPNKIDFNFSKNAIENQKQRREYRPYKPQPGFREEQAKAAREVIDMLKRRLVKGTG